MTVRVLFHSYFRDLTGCAELTRDLPSGTRLGQLLQQLQDEFPKLKSMDRSTLLAIGLEYQDRNFELQDGDEVSMFPPVQGG